jgi:hypothetical protein
MAVGVTGQPNQVSVAHLVRTGIVHANSGRPHHTLVSASMR